MLPSLVYFSPFASLATVLRHWQIRSTCVSPRTARPLEHETVSDGPAGHTYEDPSIWGVVSRQSHAVDNRQTTKLQQGPSRPPKKGKSKHRSSSLSQPCPRAQPTNSLLLLKIPVPNAIREMLRPRPNCPSPNAEPIPFQTPGPATLQCDSCPLSSFVILLSFVNNILHHHAAPPAHLVADLDGFARL